MGVAVGIFFGKMKLILVLTLASQILKQNFEGLSFDNFVKKLLPIEYVAIHCIPTVAGASGAYLKLERNLWSL